MRHALLILMLPLTLLLSGCCWDDDLEPDYHDLRLNNHTDQPISVRYTGVTSWGDDQTSHVERKVTIDAGEAKDIQVARDSKVKLKADYNHIIHWFTIDADGSCSCDLTLDMRAEDFVPAMPVANG